MAHIDDINEDELEEFEELPEDEVQPLDTIMNFLADPVNIADRLEESILVDVGNKIQDRINADKESMKDWEKFVEWGREVSEQTTAPKMRSDGAPFDRAANFKSPIMREASLKWSDRATTEILRDDDLVKSNIIGVETPEVKQKGENVAKHLNHQLNFQMDWRAKHDKMLYELPTVGNVFKKTFFNSVTGLNETSLIHYPNFIIDNNATSVQEDAFTEIRDFKPNQIEENIRSGIWIDPEMENDDNSDNVYIEHQGFYDLDDDGYEEPYLITMHKATSKVVRIVPRYEANDVFIRNESGSLVQLDEFLEAIQEEAEQTGQEPQIDFEGVDIVRVEPTNMITKYGFIPSDDGTYLDWGYYHVLGHLVSLINHSTNLMLDAGKLANMPSGLLSRAFRKAKNILRLQPGEYKSTDIDSQDLINGVYTFPFKGADASFLELIRDATQQARQLSSSIDLASVLSSNTPASTTLALIVEKTVSATAVIARVYRATSEELKILSQLNLKFTDPEEYKNILADPDAQFEVDYSEENVNVIPTANPELSSKMERIQLAEAGLSQLEAVKAEGGNTRLIIEQYYTAIGWANPEQIFEQTKGQADAAQKIKLQEQEIMKLQQENTSEQLIQTDRLLVVQEDTERRKTKELSHAMDTKDEAARLKRLELELKEEEQDRKNFETESKALVDSARTLLLEIQALKTAEEAETEAMTNNVDTLVSKFEAAIDHLNLTAGEFKDDSVVVRINQ